ncbi:MAG TPA: hypothetical protein VIL63_04965, partial [Terriglobales bacterium]
ATFLHPRAQLSPALPCWSCHKAQVSFPKRVRLTIGGSHATGVVAIGDCLDLLAAGRRTSNLAGR